ncbi:MAG: hypothetical protein SFY95_03330 [Planctomycetota bacterium]|nr:hypothetical protein [Planctomycetota bacterium]
MTKALILCVCGARAFSQGADLSWLRPLLPTPISAHVVLRSEKTGGLAAFGIDERTGAWYRYQIAEISGFDPALGAFKGPTHMERFTVDPQGRKTDSVFSRSLFPQILLRTLVDHPQCVTEAAHPTESAPGRIVFTAPWGDPLQFGKSKGRPTTCEIELDQRGFVTRTRTMIQGNDAPMTTTFETAKVLDGNIQVALTIHDGTRSDNRTVLDSAELAPAGAPWTAKYMASRAHQLRLRDPNAKNFPLPPSPSAPVVPPTRAAEPGDLPPDPDELGAQPSGLDRAGPIISIAGVVVLALGLFAWWRSRR